MPLSSPVPLAEHHETERFDSSELSLDNWLKKRALANQNSGASRTFVTCDGERVAGYYALASGSISAASVPGNFRRNMPEPIPVVLLGRLAVDRNWQRKGIGQSLIRDAALRISQAADVIGIRGIIVHALSEKASEFYTSLGFKACQGEPMTLVLTLTELRAALLHD